MGRDPACHVTLHDLHRVASKQHAKIFRSGAGTFQIEDLGSKNYTYLNSDRLKAGSPQPLQNGDEIRIGKFEIHVDILGDAPPVVGDKTVFDLSFVNPFQEGMTRLAEALEQIRFTYETANVGRKQDALSDAWEKAMAYVGDHEAHTVIAGLLAKDGGQLADVVTEQRVPASDVAAPASPPVPEPEIPSRAESKSTPFPSGVPSSRETRVSDILLELAARLVAVPWQFRHEFIGQTIVQAPETAFLYGGNVEVLRRNLLSPEVTDAEFDHRIEGLRRAMEDLLIHQVAILDGYRAGVKEGARRLIESVSSSSITEEPENLIARFNPFRYKRELDEIRETCREVADEDWAVAERKAFRPSFIKAYLARMTSMRE